MCDKLELMRAKPFYFLISPILIFIKKICLIYYFYFSLFIFRMAFLAFG